MAQIVPAVVDHDRLAAAEVESGGRRLERHRPRQPHHVLERLAQSARIALEAHAAERGPEGGGVHGHDEAKPRLPVLSDDDLLVIVVGEGNVHAWSVTGSNGHDL